jgi:hemolysin III
MNLPALHYPTPSARTADLVIHIIGLTLALFGGGVALGLAIDNGLFGKVASVLIYALGFIAMLAFSMAYNFANPRFQPFLRRLDHAGIFLMIAASYTPFTTQALSGGWAIGMSIAVWVLAVIGIVAKLFLSGLGKMFWIPLYLFLGWLMLIALQPLVEKVPFAAIILLACGGVIYSIGTLFYMSKRLKFRRAIWHGHVLAGAFTHYAAILIGVVLVSGK